MEKTNILVFFPNHIALNYRKPVLCRSQPFDGHAAMLSARNAWGHPPGPPELPTDISPFQTKTGLALLALIMVANCPSATTTRKLKKIRG